MTMSEKGFIPEFEVKKQLDLESQARFDQVVVTGKAIFKNSSLTDSSKEVTKPDLGIIHWFHDVVAPTNPDINYRLTNFARPYSQDTINDVSTYANWEQVGGPLEHINIAMKAADFLTRKIQSNLKEPNATRDDWSQTTVESIIKVKPEFVAAVAGLHDEGREVTHSFLTNEIVGNEMLRQIGIREDIIAAMPDEAVMLTPLGQDINQVIRSLPPEAVIMWIADNFGKRFPGQNRLYQKADYDNWDAQGWANNYLKRPRANSETDDFTRANMQTHVDNVPRFFDALDNWIQSVTTTNLESLTTELNMKIGPLLEPVVK